MLNKHDPMNMFRSAKTAKIEKPETTQPKKKRQYHEANLQLSFCRWVSLQYPKLDYIRHEREGKRSNFMGQLMGKYNSIGGVPDWELLDGFGMWNGLYIEFKKPDEKWLNKHGQVKPDYAHQYNFHRKSWKRLRPAYFCNSLDDAMIIIQRYVSGDPLPPQQYEFTDEDKKKYLED